jgi:precorrin-2 dehydrogenase/sirohydrochlorin ferrochelatase
MAESYISVGLRLDGRKCLIVGGGAVAFRKARTLAEKNAQLTVIAPEHNAGIEQLLEEKLLSVISREYRSPEAENYDLVISATGDETVNQTVYDDCRRAKVPVNVVDDPPRCDFIFPAVINRGSLSLAISTDGRAPYLTSFIRKMLESTFGPQWQAVTDLAEAFRAEVRRRYPDNPKKRQECFRRFLAIDWPSLFVSAKPDEVEQHFTALISSLDTAKQE